MFRQVSVAELNKLAGKVAVFHRAVHLDTNAYDASGKAYRENTDLIYDRLRGCFKAYVLTELLFLDNKELLLPYRLDYLYNHRWVDDRGNVTEGYAKLIYDKFQADLGESLPNDELNKYARLHESLTDFCLTKLLAVYGNALGSNGLSKLDDQLREFEQQYYANELRYKGYLGKYLGEDISRTGYQFQCKFSKFILVA